MMIFITWNAFTLTLLLLLRLDWFFVIFNGNILLINIYNSRFLINGRISSCNRISKSLFGLYTWKTLSFIFLVQYYWRVSLFNFHCESTWKLARIIAWVLRSLNNHLGINGNHDLLGIFIHIKGLATKWLRIFIQTIDNCLR